MQRHGGAQLHLLQGSYRAPASSQSLHCWQSIHQHSLFTRPVCWSAENCRSVLKLLKVSFPSLLLDIFFLQDFHTQRLKAPVPCQQCKGCTSCCISPTRDSSGGLKGLPGFKEASDRMYSCRMRLPDPAQDDETLTPMWERGGSEPPLNSPTPKNRVLPTLCSPILGWHSEQLGEIARGHLIFLLDEVWLLMTLLASACSSSPWKPLPHPQAFCLTASTVHLQ